jgi:hypothetical protein
MFYVDLMWFLNYCKVYADSNHAQQLNNLSFRACKSEVLNIRHYFHTITSYF